MGPSVLKTMSRPKVNVCGPRAFGCGVLLVGLGAVGLGAALAVGLLLGAAPGFGWAAKGTGARNVNGFGTLLPFSLLPPFPFALPLLLIAPRRGIGSNGGISSFSAFAFAFPAACIVTNPGMGSSGGGTSPASSSSSGCGAGGKRPAIPPIPIPHPRGGVKSSANTISTPSIPMSSPGRKNPSSPSSPSSGPNAPSPPPPKNPCGGPKGIAPMPMPPPSGPRGTKPGAPNAPPSTPTGTARPPKCTWGPGCAPPCSNGWRARLRPAYQMTPSGSTSKRHVGHVVCPARANQGSRHAEWKTWAQGRAVIPAASVPTWSALSDVEGAAAEANSAPSPSRRRSQQMAHPLSPPTAPSSSFEALPSTDVVEEDDAKRLTRSRRRTSPSGTRSSPATMRAALSGESFGGGGGWPNIKGNGAPGPKSALLAASALAGLASAPAARRERRVKRLASPGGPCGCACGCGCG
ncbi:hypothetical protein C8R45DRAFT_1020552 [Mycena sanguinolenta]|nr:hypothetical protein C8R45DRAFT_1020552 [Mycena sanguinolenta]